MRALPNDTVPHTATTAPERRAPCPSCGGTGYHPSADHQTPCAACGGTGIVRSAADAHAAASHHAGTIAVLLDLAIADEVGEAAAASLRYAAEHLIVQAAVMVSATPRHTSGDGRPASAMLSAAIADAEAELPALHAVVSGITGERAGYPTMAAAMLARSIAARMGRAEDEMAELPAGEAGSE